MINTFYKYCLTSSDQSKSEPCCLWKRLTKVFSLKGNIKARAFKDMKESSQEGITQEHSMEGAQFVDCSERQEFE